MFLATYYRYEMIESLIANKSCEILFKIKIFEFKIAKKYNGTTMVQANKLD